jgi:radical SAM protein with 4Fe4S-binding SPASM domain
MKNRYVPINKGNYSMDTPSREAEFESKKASGWEAQYLQYRKRWVEDPQSQIVREYPLLVDIELSSLCNLKCPMCYTITDKFKEQVNATRMEWSLYTKIIDEIAGKVPAVRLSLRGESTLHKKFIECIDYAKKGGIGEVSFLTHGGKLTIPYFEKMVKAGIDWITISIDGVGEDYEKIRKPLKFSDVLKKIIDIKKYKDKNNLLKPVIKVQGIWPAIKKDPELYYETFKPYVDLVAFNPLIDLLGNDTHIEYMEDFTCPQQYQRLVIGADGRVMKCANDDKNSEVIGNINNQTVYDIWHSQNMDAVRELHLRHRGFLESPVCKRCPLPRKIVEENAEVGERSFVVKNYTFRIQEIGE